MWEVVGLAEIIWPGLGDTAVAKATGSDIVGRKSRVWCGLLHVGEWLEPSPISSRLITVSLPGFTRLPLSKFMLLTTMHKDDKVKKIYKQLERV